MATLVENAAAVKEAQEAIDAAIVAKGGTTAGGLTNAAAAIAAIPSGGGKDRSLPEGWEDVYSILDANTDDYSSKVIVLYDVPKDGLSLTLKNADFYRLADATYSSGQVISIPSGTKKIWVIYESNRPMTITNSELFPLVYYSIGNEGATYNLRINDEHSILYAIDGSGEIITNGYWTFRKNRQLRRITGETLRPTGVASYIIMNAPIETLDLEFDLSGATSIENIFYEAQITKLPNLVLPNGMISANRFAYLSRLEDFSNLDFSKFNSIEVFRYGVIIKLPKIFDISGVTTSAGMRNSFVAFYLYELPIIKSNFSLDFSTSTSVDRDSVAKFTNGEITGGMVYELQSWDGVSVDSEGNRILQDICPNDGQTITLSSSVKNLFTAEEQAAIATAMTAKNWGLVW